MIVRGFRLVLNGTIRTKRLPNSTRYSKLHPATALHSGAKIIQLLGEKKVMLQLRDRPRGLGAWL